MMPAEVGKALLGEPYIAEEQKLPELRGPKIMQQLVSLLSSIPTPGGAAVGVVQRAPKALTFPLKVMSRPAGGKWKEGGIIKTPKEFIQQMERLDDQIEDQMPFVKDASGKIWQSTRARDEALGIAKGEVEATINKLQGGKLQ